MRKNNKFNKKTIKTAELRKVYNGYIVTLHDENYNSTESVHYTVSNALTQINALEGDL